MGSRGDHSLIDCRAKERLKERLKDYIRYRRHANADILLRSESLLNPQLNPLRILALVVSLGASAAFWATSTRAQAAELALNKDTHAHGVALSNERSHHLHQQEQTLLLERIRNLIAHGAVGLALRLIEDRQPTASEAPAAWREWEFERIRCYLGLKDYSSLIARVDVLPKDLPVSDRLQLMTFGAEAELAIAEPTRARDRLRSLLFGADVVGKESVDAWRRLVIQSYIDERRFEDARTAMLKLDAEAPANDWAWLRLKSRVLLLAGDEAAVVALSKGRDELEARLLVTLARFRLRSLDASGARDRVVQIRALALNADIVSTTTRAMSWMVQAEIDQADDDLLGAVRSLEQRAIIETDVQDILVAFTVTDLWRGWQRAAEQIANLLDLEPGAFDSWIEAADLLVDGDPSAARVLYAAVVLDATDYRIRSEAHAGLVRTLLSTPETTPLALFIYTQNSDDAASQTTRARIDELDSETRLKLSDVALNAKDMAAAALLLRGLDRAPDGVGEQAWTLRRARIAVYAGEFEEGARLLQRLVDEYDSMSAEAMDQMLQPVFDLQSLNEHELALPILRRSLFLVGEPRFSWEIPFWTAQSAAALGRHAEAAELYLRSAEAAALSSNEDADSNRLWHLSAQIHAAEQMAHAGLPGDARRLYERLLSELDDDSRRADIEHRMQKLYVVEAAKHREDARK